MTRRRKNPSPKGDLEIVEFESSRKLTTIGPEHQVWDPNRTAEGIKKSLEYLVRGSLVRVRPPYHASDAKIAFVKTCIGERCSGFKVEAREPAPAVLANDVSAEPRINLDESPRDVINRIVARAYTDNRELLKSCVEEALAHAENRRCT